jgi:DNA modification methylase
VTEIPNLWRIDVCDVLDGLRGLPDGCVHCCVTSPPYWGLRSYLPKGHEDKHREIGSEPTPEKFVETMVQVFREVRRVMHPSGTCWQAERISK